MLSNARYWACLALGVFLTVAPGAVRADVKGVVHDAGKTAPNDGLNRVTVTLEPIKGKSISTRTDAKGKYQFTNPPSCEFQLKFDRIGYVPRPREAAYDDVKDAGFD